MLLELFRFLFAFSLLILPGIALAWRFSIGRSSIDRFAYGSTLGLALAAYLAFLISQWELAWFYPVWTAIIVIAIILVAIKRSPAESSRTEKLMIPLLLLVGISRIGVAMPHVLPSGWDPSFHLLLALRIQETGRAIHDWMPYANAALNYPTGSHTLLVILARLGHLSLPAVFKYFVQVLGAITTAQMFTFARRATGDDRSALFAAAAYGMLAWYGSLNYFDWGGLPNELGMLLLIGAMSLWIDHKARFRAPALAIFLAAIPLVHHHVMLVAAALMTTAYLVTFITRRRQPISILLAPVISIVLASFFVIPYALKVRTVSSTNVFKGGEEAMLLREIPTFMGYAIVLLSVIGLLLWMKRRMMLHPLVIGSIAMLLALFIATEYGWPLWLKMHHEEPSTALTPSRFITDMNYFLPLLAGVAITAFAARIRAATWAILLVVCLLSLTELAYWRRLASTAGDPPGGFIRACEWISQNTPQDTLVLNAQYWTAFLTQRRAAGVPLPISEPQVDFEAPVIHANAVIEGRVLPNPGDKMFVAVIMPATGLRSNFPILYVDPETGVRVVKFWPR